MKSGFSKQDIKGFEEKYIKDLSLKQYELESARVYESASKQIEIKKQKFNNVSQKMINEYGAKYQEILSKDISADEKIKLSEKLLDDTKSYDERNRQSVYRLNLEYEKLAENFHGKVEKASTIYKQMQNLHLFDKNRYFEDMMSSSEPALRDLYRKRYLLNSYRKSHNEPIYSNSQSSFTNFFKNISNNFRKNHAPLMLGPHFEREYLGNKQKTNTDSVDKDLLKALASFYGNAVLSDTVDFEAYLVDYFKPYYEDLIGEKSHDFLVNFSRSTLNADSKLNESGDLFKIARHFDIDTSVFADNIGADLNIKDGLIYEESIDGLNVIYATPKAIATIYEDLYGTSLYYKHLATKNALASDKAASLQNSFAKYAAKNEIELNSDLKLKKRFIKRKNSKTNIIKFKQESC